VRRLYRTVRRAKGIEQVLRDSHRVTQACGFVERAKRSLVVGDLFLKARDYSIGDQRVRRRDPDGTSGGYLIGDILQNDHFSININKRTYSEVSVFQKVRDTKRALVQALYEGC
jgi:hypothetical protein